MGLVGYFTAQQACRLARITPKMLRGWSHPSASGAPVVVVPEDVESTDFDGLYTFADVVGLRTLGMLRAHLSLQKLRTVAVWLRKRYDMPWSRLKFSVHDGEVDFFEPGSSARVGTTPLGQVKLFALADIASEVEGEVRALLRRPADTVGNLSRKRGVLHNATTVAGTRISTSAIWNFHRAGYDVEHIKKEYPSLTDEDVRAALEFESGRRANTG